MIDNPTQPRIQFMQCNAMRFAFGFFHAQCILHDKVSFAFLLACSDLPDLSCGDDQLLGLGYEVLRKEGRV